MSLRFRVALYDAPAMHDNAIPPGLFLQTLDERAGNALRGFIKAGIGTKIGPVFREGDAFRAHVGGLIDK